MEVLREDDSRKFCEFNQTKLSYLHVKSQSNSSLILVHGSRRDANAEHWRPYFSWLSKYSSIFSIDLLGHGMSSNISTSTEAQVNTLVELVKQNNLSNNLILLGRSYGGQVVLELASKLMQDKKVQISGLILIAPAVNRPILASLPKELTSKPLLVCWAEDDPIISFVGCKTVQEFFPNMKLVNFGKVGWNGHFPECENPSLFEKEVTAFLQSIN